MGENLSECTDESITAESGKGSAPNATTEMRILLSFKNTAIIIMPSPDELVCTIL